jgi:hypothetical protein
MTSLLILNLSFAKWLKFLCYSKQSAANLTNNQLLQGGNKAGTKSTTGKVNRTIAPKLCDGGGYMHVFIDDGKDAPYFDPTTIFLHPYFHEKIMQCIFHLKPEGYKVKQVFKLCSLDLIM